MYALADRLKIIDIQIIENLSVEAFYEWCAYMKIRTEILDGES